MSYRRLIWCILLCGAFSIGAAAQKRPPEKVQAHLYGADTDGVAVEHRLEKGVYQVRYTLTGLIFDRYPKNIKKWKPPKQTLEVPLPEAGRFSKPKVTNSLMIQATVKVTAKQLVVTLQHTKYLPPPPRDVETASLGASELMKLSDKIIGGCFPRSKAGKVKGVMRSQIRGSRARNARNVLHALCLAYHVPEKAEEKQPLTVWRYTAKLMGIKARGDRERVFLAVRQGLVGYRIAGQFEPSKSVMASATQASVRGEIGRAVLVGKVGGSNPNDWWRVVMSDPDDPIAALEAPKALVWVKVIDPDLKGCYLRVFSAAKQPVGYKLEVINKSGPKHQWVEVHESPAPDEKLPQ